MVFIPNYLSKIPSLLFWQKGGLWPCWGSPAINPGGQEPPVLGAGLPLPVNVVSRWLEAFPGSRRERKRLSLLPGEATGDPEDPCAEGRRQGRRGISGVSGMGSP